jgi:hypothetical protein
LASLEGAKHSPSRLLRHTTLYIGDAYAWSEPSKRVADYCGTSSAMIEGSYAKWIGGNQGFGEAALKAAKPKFTET